MALFDAGVNNADRKGGHVLAMADGHRFGIDHGVTFNVDPKLRTVLWGWAGEPIGAGEQAALEGLLDHTELDDRLAELITTREIASFRRRCERLLDSRSFPLPSGQWPSIPWPAF